MATKLAIAEAMGDQIRDVLTDVDWDFQVEHLMVLNPSAICVDVYPGDPATDAEVASFADSLADMGAGFIFNVRARVSPNDHEAGQEVLYELSDPVSDISLVQALYDGKDSIHVEAQVRYEDGRTGTYSADLKIRDAKTFPPAAAKRAA